MYEKEQVKIKWKLKYSAAETDNVPLYFPITVNNFVVAILKSGISGHNCGYHRYVKEGYRNLLHLGNIYLHWHFLLFATRMKGMLVHCTLSKALNFGMVKLSVKVSIVM